MNKWERRHQVHWTNWTVGVWWGIIGSYRWHGIDLGPIQLAWKKRKEKIV